MNRAASLVLALAVVASMVVGGQARAEVPGVLHYQGYVTDPQGEPIQGTLQMTFSLYQNQLGGDAFWSETQPIAVSKGVFTAVLGAKLSNPLSPSLLSSGEAWMEIAVKGSQTLTVILEPRQRVTSSPFAMYTDLAGTCLTADNALAVGGVDASSVLTTENAAQTVVRLDQLDSKLKALGYSSGPHYSDLDVQDYLDSIGVEAGGYDDNDVAYYLQTNGFAPGPVKWTEIQGRPEGVVTTGNAAASGLFLMANGTVPASGALNLAKNQVLNMVIQNAPTTSAPPSPAAGQLWFDSTEGALKVFANGAWVGLGSATELACTGCVGDEDVDFNYAGSTEKNGPANSALDVDCLGCVEADEVAFNFAASATAGGDASGVDCVGCVDPDDLADAALAASAHSYDPTTTGIAATTVQGAIDLLASTGPGNINEGNGTVFALTDHFTFPTGPSTVYKYVHLMNPSTPKVILYLYSEYAQGSSGTYPQGVKIYIDGVNVTATVGNPNSKASPNWDATNVRWGADKTQPWTTGALDLSNVANWTTGQHKVELRQEVNSSGPIDMYIYVIYPFSVAKAPDNDTCTGAKVLNAMAGNVTVSGTTEDTMGKTKAKNDYVQAGCGGGDGTDVVYKFELTDWRDVSLTVSAAFDARVYLRKTDCATGELVACGSKTLNAGTLKTGTYYLFVDSDGNALKGDFILNLVAAVPAPPSNNNCTAPTAIVFDADHKGSAYGQNLFATNSYEGTCGGALGRDVVFYFDLPANTAEFTVSIDCTFNPVLYFGLDKCEEYSGCAPTKTFSRAYATGGRYYVVVDGKTAADKGEFTLNVSYTLPQ